MDTTQWFVTGVGFALIVLIALFFFTSTKGAAMSATTSNGVQQQRIIVKGGYSPSTIHVVAGTPVHLVFDRQEHSACSEELVIPHFGVRRKLPAHQQTSIDFTPTKPGTFEFACGMNMLKGKIVVEEVKEK